MTNGIKASLIVLPFLVGSVTLCGQTINGLTDREKQFPIAFRNIKIRPLR